LKLKYDELLSNFAFNFNVRRYEKKGVSLNAGLLLLSVVALVLPATLQVRPQPSSCL